jgi:tetratricopeptide (TPR) repeat protein
VGTVERVANAVASGLQGVSSLRQGNVLSGLASIGAAVAGGIGRGAGNAASGLQRFADRLGQVSGHLQSVAQGVGAVQSYRAADRAVRAAREALARAEASGDVRAITAARQQLEQAERSKRAALLQGVGTAAMIGADTVGQYRRPAPGQPIDRPTAGTRLESALRIVSRGSSTAGSVVLRDWEAAGVGALGVAAGISDLRGSGSPENQSAAERRADTILGSGPRVSTLNDAANMADAALGYRQAERVQEAAEAAVKDAERALDIARRSGDAQAIREAEESLRQARRAAEGALMGEIGAADAMVQTPQAILAQRRAAREFETARDGAVRAFESAEKTAEQVEAVGRDLPADLRGDAREVGGRLADAHARYEEMLRAAGGDPAKIATATWGFMAEQMGAWADLSLLEAEAAERTRPRIVPASATGQSPVDPREQARGQIRNGRGAVEDALDQGLKLRIAMGADGRYLGPELEIETAAHAYEAALDRLETVLDRGGSDVDRRRAQAEAHLAHLVLDAARNPRRSPSDPPPWAVGLGTFVKEFGTGALAVVSFGGTAGIQRAYEQGRLNARSGPDDLMRFYLEGVFSGITFGGGDAYVNARAGEGRGFWGSSGGALLATLKGVAGYDEVQTILFDPKADAWEKGQAISTLVAKWAGLAALGVSRTRYAEMDVADILGRRPGAGAGGPAGAGGAGTAGSGRSIWSEPEVTRGRLVEEQLAKTEYRDWYHVGKEQGGTFELVDFQKGQNLVSLKTVDTAGKSWMGRAQAHIRDLSTRGATVSGQPANMILDLRVPPGGAAAAQSLVAYGKARGVTVVIKVIP